MAFLEERFPDDISYGSTGGPMFSTDVIRFGNGTETRNANWAYPLWGYNIAYGIKSPDQFQTAYVFFLVSKGRHGGFRLKDWNDYTTNPDNGQDAPTALDQVIGVGDGTTTTFQLRKTYGQGVLEQVRILKKPVAGTALAALDGGVTTAFSADTTTGEVTFNTAPADGVTVTAGCEFDVPVRFDIDSFDGIRFIEAFKDGKNCLSVDSIPLLELRNP